MWTLILLAQSCVAVPGDRILARDLAPSVGALSSVHPETFFGYAPLPGLERRLTRNDLERALGPGLAGLALPSSVCVVRTGRPVGEAEIRAAMRKALPEDAELDLIHWSQAPVPAGRLEFAAAGLRRTPQPGMYVWRGQSIPESGGRSVPIAAVARIRLRRQIIVAARDIEPGAELTPADWVAEERDVAIPFDNPLPDGYPAAGWRARRRIAAGQPLKPTDWIPPAAARAGQMVTLVCESGAARLAMEAQALTSGRLGDVILVKSPLNGKRLRARLEAIGRAVAERKLP